MSILEKRTSDGETTPPENGGQGPSKVPRTTHPSLPERVGVIQVVMPDGAWRLQPVMEGQGIDLIEGEVVGSTFWYVRDAGASGPQQAPSHVDEEVRERVDAWLAWCEARLLLETRILGLDQRTPTQRAELASTIADWADEVTFR